VNRFPFRELGCDHSHSANLEWLSQVNFNPLDGMGTRSPLGRLTVNGEFRPFFRQKIGGSYRFIQSQVLGRQEGWIARIR
jgi:hypothetical protein